MADTDNKTAAPSIDADGHELSLDQFKHGGSTRRDRELPTGTIGTCSCGQVWRVTDAPKNGGQALVERMWRDHLKMGLQAPGEVSQTAVSLLQAMAMLGGPSEPVGATRMSAMTMQSLGFTKRTAAELAENRLAYVKDTLTRGWTITLSQEGRDYLRRSKQPVQPDLIG